MLRSCRAIESARIVEEAEACIPSDSPHDEHVGVNQPWLEHEEVYAQTSERMRVGSLGRRRASMIPQELNVLVPSEGPSSLEEGLEKTETHQPTADVSFPTPLLFMYADWLEEHLGEKMILAHSKFHVHVIEKS